VADCQDSGLLSVLADANALVVRPPNDPAKTAGDVVDVLDL
jgi:molybdopterin molybdotransferase